MSVVKEVRRAVVVALDLSDLVKSIIEMETIKMVIDLYIHLG